MARASALRDARGFPPGDYAWRGRPASAREQRRDTLLVEIRAVHAEVKARYGSPRIHAELVARGQSCCVNTVAKLMRASGIAAKTARKFRCTTDSNHDLPVAENLLDRQFDPESPNASWVADITYIPTQQGWLYLAAVEDLYSRRVVDGRPPGKPPGGRRPGAGGGTAPAGRRAAGAFRPRGPVRQRALPAAAGKARHHLQHEPAGRLLG
jgi:hypothetical protein